VTVSMVISLFGGLGLFLYGMKLMGDGLEIAAGSRLKFILEKVTANPLRAVFVGAIVTAIIQSSSATTVMVVGFVNSGLLTLVQATGIIMGANIGTTMTAFLVSMDISGFVPILIFLGSAVLLFSTSKKYKGVASIVLGFGILMLGMSMMGDAMSPLRDSATFKMLIMTIGTKWYFGLALGLGITMIIQSSSATTGILIALTATGSITIEIAFPIILGANIGTCITALLSSITANKMAKKAAVIHLLFNVIGAIIFLPLGALLIDIVKILSPVNVKLQISFIHLLFNLSNTILLLPFSAYLITMAERIVGVEVDMNAEILDKRLLETPSIAEGQVILETAKMAELAKENVRMATDAFINGDLTNMDLIYKTEERINKLTEIITNFLVDLSSLELDVKEFKRIGDTYHVINDIERIGDHAENILELAQEKLKKNAEISEAAKEELKNIYSYTDQALTIAIESYKNNDKVKALSIETVEDTIDELQKKYRDAHIRRLNTGKCSVIPGILFIDLISNFERIGDHSINIAETINSKIVVE